MNHSEVMELGMKIVDEVLRLDGEGEINWKLQTSLPTTEGIAEMYKAEVSLGFGDVTLNLGILCDNFMLTCGFMPTHPDYDPMLLNFPLEAVEQLRDNMRERLKGN